MEKFLNLIFVLMLILIYSCTDQIINTVVDNEEVNRINKTLMALDSSIINPDKPLCGTKDVVMWNLEFYLPKPNKVLGIWSKFASGEEFYSLKNKFGYTKVRVSNETQKNWAIGAGFYLSQQMAPITVYGDGSYAYPSGDFGSYYIDEPFERFPSLTTSNIISIAYQINAVHSNVKIELISYKKPVDGFTMMYSIVLGGTSNPEMTCDQYYDQSIWCGDDQRTHWTLFKNYYTSARVKSHFIHLLIDEQQGDFNMLFGHANNLGINELWIYAGDAGDDWCGEGEILTEPYYDLYLYELSSAAWSNGWLRAIQRKYIYEYHCSYPDPCDCDPDLPDGWYLNRIYPMNEYREEFPDGTIIPYNP